MFVQLRVRPFPRLITILVRTYRRGPNGNLLTVLSVLARQNVDPWEEAADLSRLPRDTAARKLLSIITASPALSSMSANQTAVVDRLIALLPARIASADGTPAALPDLPPKPRSPRTRKLTLIAIYIGAMLLTQWIAASIFERTPVEVASRYLPRPRFEKRSQALDEVR